MAAILDAILDFSARTNFRQCIPLVSQTIGYKVYFGICHVLLYFYEHPTFILALKVTLLYPLLHIKCQGNQSTGSREEICKVFTVNRHGSHVGHVTWTIWTNFFPLSPRPLYIKLCDNWPCDFWDVWNCNTMRALGQRSNNDHNLLFSQIFI